MRDLPSKELERKRALVDHSITSETRQPTVEGKPCRYCDSTVKFAKRKGTCVRCHKQWRRDYEIKSSKYSNSGLGFFKDNPERLSAAIEYLRTC